MYLLESSLQYIAKLIYLMDFAEVLKYSIIHQTTIGELKLFEKKIAILFISSQSNSSNFATIKIEFTQKLFYFLI